MGVAYDASAGIIVTALRIASTIIPEVLRGWEFWALLIFNSAVCIARHTGAFEPHQYHIDLPWGLTGVTGSLMTFFVCFYNAHVFGRYNKLYDITQLMAETILELVSLVRLQIDDRAVQRKIAKLVIASCFMFFFERSDGTGSKISATEYNQLRNLGLITEIEKDKLESYCKNLGVNAVPSFLLLQWGMELIRFVTPNAIDREDMLQGLYSSFYRIRSCQSKVTQIMDLPMPFQYFHIMNLMLMLNLLLWAYALGCQDSYFAPIIYMFVQMMFQGIRELSTALSDPFGDDEVDFPVNDWMQTMYVRMYGILEDRFDIRDIDLDAVQPLQDPVMSGKLINLHVDRHEAEASTQGAE